MSDYKVLVYRLREYTRSTTMYHPFVTEAADAIERLRRERDEARSALFGTQEVRDEIAKERDALRAKLEATEAEVRLGRLVRSKLTSGDSVPVERCIVFQRELQAIDAAIAAQEPHHAKD